MSINHHYNVQFMRATHNATPVLVWELFRHVVFPRKVDGRPLEYWDKFEKKKQFFLHNLSHQEYHVLRQRGTELPGSSEYDKFYPTHGYFACRACGNPLYAAESKFESERGREAFGEFVSGHILPGETAEFPSRTEVHCSRCQSHLGYVYAERHPSKLLSPCKIFIERHCINGICLKYVDQTLPAGSSNAPKVMALKHETTE